MKIKDKFFIKKNEAVNEITLNYLRPAAICYSSRALCRTAFTHTHVLR